MPRQKDFCLPNSYTRADAHICGLRQANRETPNFSETSCDFRLAASQEVLWTVSGNVSAYRPQIFCAPFPRISAEVRAKQCLSHYPVSADLGGSPSELQQFASLRDVDLELGFQFVDAVKPTFAS